MMGNDTLHEIRVHIDPAITHLEKAIAEVDRIINVTDLDKYGLTRIADMRSQLRYQISELEILKMQLGWK